MKKILIIEDCPQTQLVLKRILSSLAEVECASTTTAARGILGRYSPDMALLDLQLPDGDGFSFCSEIQAQYPNLPIVFITGQSEVSSKVTAFSMGAEDYIVKPFDVIELRARLEAKLKKLAAATPTAFRVGHLQIDLAKQSVVNLADGARPVQLTAREFKLLAYFAHHENHLLSREQLLDAVWGNASSVFDRTIDTHISAIRRKLGPLGVYIESVKGSGYRFNPSALAAKAA